MTLIKCEGCGREIRKNVGCCPHCGCIPDRRKNERRHKDKPLFRLLAGLAQKINA